jgi:hypothetical protein
MQEGRDISARASRCRRRENRRTPHRSTAAAAAAAAAAAVWRVVRSQFIGVLLVLTISLSSLFSHHSSPIYELMRGQYILRYYVLFFVLYCTT